MQKILARQRMTLGTFVIALLFLSRAGAAQFVEITAEIQIEDWGYRFQDDRNGWSARRGQLPHSVFMTSAPIRCVVGTNAWMMESDFIYRDAKVTRWFTGSNIIERSLITKATSEDEIKRLSQTTRLAMSSPRVGDQHTQIYETADGNPGRPVRVADLFMDSGGMMSWLVFCSGPALKRPVINPYRVGHPSQAVAVISDEPWAPAAGAAHCFALSDGARHLCFAADGGGNFRIEASPDLFNWETLFTTLGIDGAWHFVDADAENHPCRFYRLRLEPGEEVLP